MRLRERILAIVTGSLLMLFAVLIVISSFLDEELGYALIVIAIGATLIAGGVGNIFYYFTMSRFMIGGRWIFYLGVLRLDMGVFTLTLYDDARFFIALYIGGLNLFHGAVDILKGLEARRNGSLSWKRSVIHGVFNTVIAVLCLIFASRGILIILVYAFGLVGSAVIRIVSAFRKTAVVYIQ